MSIYKCKLMPMEKLLVGPIGVMEPLCNNCQNRDCENPIQPMQVTVFGRMTTWKVYAKGSKTSMVLQCEGYSPDHASI
jgi:hypothetical protein